MSKSTKKKNNSKYINEFTMVNPNAAGIDVSSKDYVVAVPPDRDDTPIKTFGGYTCDLNLIAEWLISCNIDTVAMESTGIYWKQLFVVLQEYGLQVYLVNSRHVKNVTGKKTDEQDAHWIMRLHTCGLLSNSFQPEEQVRTLRELLRHRKSLGKTKSVAVNKMTKALNMMNLKLNMVLSDITSVSAQRIIQAIISGERNPEELIQYVHYKVKAPRPQILKALQAVWREECLFELQQGYDHYQFLQSQVSQCDQKIEQQLQQIVCQVDESKVEELKQKAKKKRIRKDEFRFSPSVYLEKILGTDPSQVNGFSDETLLTLYAETGSDLSGFKTADHFASWIGLVPNNKISGGKILSSNIPKKKHPIKMALLHAANSLYRSDDAMGNYYRRMKSKHGPQGAKVALARKMAIIYYHMVTQKESFNIKLFEQQQAKFKANRIKYLEKQLADLKQVA